MNPAIIDYFRAQLIEAADFVVGRIDVNMSHEAIYEQLINNADDLNVFQASASLMHQRHLRTGADINLHGKQVSVKLRLDSTDKYPTYLLPQRILTPASELEQALQLPIQVASDWALLLHVTDKLFDLDMDTHIYLFLMPWLRDVWLDVAENNDPRMLLSKWGRTNIRKAEIASVARDIKKLMSRTVPRKFPLLTYSIGNICKHGKMLFAQYRMLKTTDTRDSTESNPLTIARNGLLLPESFIREMEEVFQLWEAQAYEVTQRVNR